MKSAHVNVYIAASLDGFIAWGNETPDRLPGGGGDREDLRSSCPTRSDWPCLGSENGRSEKRKYSFRNRRRFLEFTEI